MQTGCLTTQSKTGDRKIASRRKSIHDDIVELNNRNGQQNKAEKELFRQTTLNFSKHGPDGFQPKCTPQTIKLE